MAKIDPRQKARQPSGISLRANYDPMAQRERALNDLARSSQGGSAEARSKARAALNRKFTGIGSC